MYPYNFDQWILLFFLYAFAGYIWEEVYCSICQRKLVNRGFLYGPLLPIYGFGAVIILHVVLLVADSVPLIFILGLLAATILEYFTGAEMEKLFDVKYWDYSKEWGNIKGYICPKASLAWGIFSILLVKYVNPFFENILFSVPAFYANILAHVLVPLIMVDTTLSAKHAFDLKKMLREFKEAKMKELIERREEFEAKKEIFVQERKEEIRERKEHIEEQKERLEEAKERALSKIESSILFADENNNGIPDILEIVPKELRKSVKRILDNNPSAKLSQLEELIKQIRSEKR